METAAPPMKTEFKNKTYAQPSNSNLTQSKNGVHYRGMKLFNNHPSIIKSSNYNITKCELNSISF
jgi:hypothetical protein